MARDALLLPVLVTLLAGCQGEQQARPDPTGGAPAPVATIATSAHPIRIAPRPTMSVKAIDLDADPTVDVRAIRSTLRDAETALLSCLDPGSSTGVLVLSFPIERGGAVGEVTEKPTTTYGSEDARACVARLIGAMRFPASHGDGRAEIHVTLEVAPVR